MAINATFYLDAGDLASAVSVYLDSNLDNLAPDGFYGNGLITRQQSSGILLAAEDCASCGTPCGQDIFAQGGVGIYLLNIDLGSTASDVGAVIIRFKPQGKPDGIRVIYDSVVYNKLSSPVDGLHQSGTPGNFTIIGDINQTEACSQTWYPNGGVITLDEYLYSGNSFNLTGDSQEVEIAANDISVGQDPDFSVMVIPKLDATPNTINIQVIGDCGGSTWDIEMDCPAPLPSFSSTSMSNSPNIPCGAPLSNIFYFAKVHLIVDPSFDLGLYDYVFSDANGQFPLAPGYYLSNNKVFLVENGIIINIEDCIPTS